MIRYAIVAMLDDVRVCTCGHQHRTKTAAVKCRWMPPAGTVYTSMGIGKADPLPEPVKGSKRAKWGEGRDRGAISVSGAHYDRLALQSDRTNMSISKIVEGDVNKALDAMGWPQHG